THCELECQSNAIEPLLNCSDKLPPPTSSVRIAASTGALPSGQVMRRARIAVTGEPVASARLPAVGANPVPAPAMRGSTAWLDGSLGISVALLTLLPSES